MSLLGNFLFVMYRLVQSNFYSAVSFLLGVYNISKIEIYNRFDIFNNDSSDDSDESNYDNSESDYNESESNYDESHSDYDDSDSDYDDSDSDYDDSDSDSDDSDSDYDDSDSDSDDSDSDSDYEPEYSDCETNSVDELVDTVFVDQVYKNNAVTFVEKEDKITQTPV